MGNYAFRTLRTSPADDSGDSVRVIFPGGEIRRFYDSVKAAELMFELPNFFLASTEALRIGKRFPALNADEDLKVGEIYVFFPMKRLNSSVTSSDLGGAANACNTTAAIGIVRVSPDSQIEESAENCPVEKLNLEGIEELSSPEFRQRSSKCRSKKPSLETIVEETVNLRFMFMIES